MIGEKNKLIATLFKDKTASQKMCFPVLIMSITFSMFFWGDIYWLELTGIFLMLLSLIIALIGVSFKRFDN